MPRVREERPPDDAVVCRIATGAIALMKGHMAPARAPLVHRSPPVAGTGTHRLVLVFDVPQPAGCFGSAERIGTPRRPGPVPASSLA